MSEEITKAALPVEAKRVYTKRTPEEREALKIQKTEQNAAKVQTKADKKAAKATKQTDTLAKLHEQHDKATAKVLKLAEKILKLTTNKEAK